MSKCQFTDILNTQRRKPQKVRKKSVYKEKDLLGFTRKCVSQVHQAQIWVRETKMQPFSVT